MPQAAQSSGNCKAETQTRGCALTAAPFRKHSFRHEGIASQAWTTSLESRRNRLHSDARRTRLIHQNQKERRATAARRSLRFIYPKTAAQKLHQSRSVLKDQNPQNGHHGARFDWGFGAICFGASPVAAVFGSAPGSATPPEHRIHFNPTPPHRPSKKDISTWQRRGHFYLALTE